MTENATGGATGGGGEALAGRLLAAGIDRVVAGRGVAPLPGMPMVAAPDGESAELLAEAEGVFGRGLGASWDGAVLTLASRPRPPDAAEPVTVSSPDALTKAIDAARTAGAGWLAVRPDFDPHRAAASSDAVSDAVSDAASGPTPAHRTGDPSLARRLEASPLSRGERVGVDLILAGRGVIRAGAVPALREIAERTGLGVLNTFTGKGMFRWDSAFHLGTGCLQQRDLALAGVHPDGAVLAIGVDADECVPALLEAAGVDPAAHVMRTAADLADPGALAGLADQVRAAGQAIRGGTPGADVARPALYRNLAAVVQPLYTRRGTPLNPARAAADLAEALPEHGAVFAEPGLPGLWIARALPTSRLGSARVPAAGRPGVAVAGAVLAGARGEVGIAVLDRPPDGCAASLIAFARAQEIPLVVEVWGGSGTVRGADEHRDSLRAALVNGGVHVIDVAVDLTHTEALVGVAGGVVAWPDTAAPLPR